MPQENVHVNISVSIGATRYAVEPSELSVTLPKNMLTALDYHTLIGGLWQAAANDYIAQQEREAEIGQEAKEKKYEYTLEELKPN